ncbi:hypothetical protein [Paenibacillus senegalimassiliensis]|uniref:hypothetical protein n=1 Tax=Paenibacillus senegalimassiliensis TaxID=1737426 RepID=UPI00073EC6D7|nr:hypothetical protein [Paenibacillus senegalimassiliensis]
MSVVEEVLNKIKLFVDGVTDAEEFSFDFPDDLADAYEGLERENKPLAVLLNDEIPDICAAFQPDEAARRGEPELLNEDQFRQKVTKVYEKANKLV